jgi:exosortase
MTDSKALLARRHVIFFGFVLISILLFWQTIGSLISYALHDESGSHIILIPLVSVFLLYMDRDRILVDMHGGIGLGIVLLLAGIFTWWLGNTSTFFDHHTRSLSAQALSLVLLWIAGFAVCYGSRVMRAAAFPLLFLLLMVPLPEAILARTIYWLQEGSTEVAYLLFKAVGVPTLRQGFFLSVPGVTIEVAQECSGIRSSIALFITCVLAAHFFLRTPWKILLFIGLTVPLAVIKNGIRIVTLTLLSIYVDPSFLKGSLHRDGGFVFFILALVIVFPIMLLMRKSESPQKGASPPASTEQDHQFARS